MIPYNGDIGGNLASEVYFLNMLKFKLAGKKLKLKTTNCFYMTKLYIYLHRPFPTQEEYILNAFTRINAASGHIISWNYPTCTQSACALAPGT